MVDEELKGNFVGELRRTSSLPEDWREESATMRRENVAMHEELRRHMDTAFEGLRHDIRRIIDSLNAVDQSFMARMDDRAKRMEQSFDELQGALIDAGLTKPHRPTRRRTKPN